MPNYRKLKTTPIKEIIFTISFKEDIDVENLKKFCEMPEVAERFSAMHEGFKTNIQAKADQKPTTDVTNDGYILRSSTSNNIIQVRRGSFAFHQIKEYEHFEKLFEELTDFWNKFIGLVGQLTINNISLRYLNFIEQNEKESIEQLIKVSAQYPYEYNLNNQFIRLHFNSLQNPDLKINIVTAKGVDDNKNGIILDTILSQQINNLVDYKEVLDNFHFMRGVKNDIFFKSLTDYALQKYYGE